LWRELPYPTFKNVLRSCDNFSKEQTNLLPWWKNNVQFCLNLIRRLLQWITRIFNYRLVHRRGLGVQLFQWLWNPFRWRFYLQKWHDESGIRTDSAIYLYSIYSRTNVWRQSLIKLLHFLSQRLYIQNVHRGINYDSRHPTLDQRILCKLNDHQLPTKTLVFN